MKLTRITEAQIRQVVEDAVAWENGTGSEWECDAIISVDLLRKLVKLAAKAPFNEKNKVFQLA